MIESNDDWTQGEKESNEACLQAKQQWEEAKKLKEETVGKLEKKQEAIA